MNQRVVTMPHGRYVRGFPNQHAGPEITKLAESYRNLLSAADQAKARAAEIARDPNLSDLGKKAAMQDWFKAQALPALAGSRATLTGADAAVFGTRALMTKLAPDKADIAGAMVRAQTRDWLRAMDPAQRVAMVTAPDMDPAIALAIAEAPAALSGVTPQQAERLATGALAALNPEETAKIAGIEEAALAVADAQRMAMLTISDAAGVTEDQMVEAMGGPTLQDRFRAILERGSMNIDHNAEDDASGQAA